ncbi:MAG: pyrophosphate--fructose-6-phosphate 1-phosphotransferase [Aestuariivirga sp.]|uniref:pyrophosphate--fructose-6-phosphate 1-phosphotransferase n=1 Tax=Aestuariivirga sp. TaxID=2650926 RepID=UPI0025BF955A|nr:pyrophosphate--fructose-6-phosphate 1-phosphotransferase [Aestuariivirga sp.]MCA3560484.1 pyrophosphate--fructose-6-phosphate 1-phosphotransferase [Aestuariivirga sp.]
MTHTHHKIAMLTAGGLAPCLSSAVGGLIERYSEIAPDAPMIGYLAGYKGLLQGKYIPVTPEVRRRAHVLHGHGGSPLGNSRVKLTNAADCVKRGLVKDGEDPLKVAAKQLVKDGVTILHTIGGDDTNTTAADLAAYLHANGYELTVVGLPKTIDNDVIPIRQTLGAWTAAEHGALFFENVVNEQSTSSRQLVIHEVMGRHCGWLTAATARAWRGRLDHLEFLPEFNLDRKHKDIDAVYVPEMTIDMEKEAARLRKVMDQYDSVSIFVSEGACVQEIVAELEAKGEPVERDAFGHVRLDSVKVGDWFGKQFARKIGADKTLVQKSGYFGRSAAANQADLDLIRAMVHVAVDSALDGVSGVIGHDEDKDDELRAIEFPRIKGGKHFDVHTPWFAEMLKDIGQTA